MNVNDIIKGPFFPEAIEVKSVESFGEEYLLLEGIGCQTNQYYERLFMQDELQPEFPEFITREGQPLTPHIIPSASS